MNRNDAMWKVLRRCDKIAPAKSPLPPHAVVMSVERELRVASHAAYSDIPKYREQLEVIAARCILALEQQEQGNEQRG